MSTACDFDPLAGPADGDNVRHIRGKAKAAESAPGREPLLVSGAADSVEWLHANLGTAELSGMFNRAGSVVYCPQVTAAGYTPPADDMDGPGDVRLVDASVLASYVQLLRWCYKMVEDKETGEKIPVPVMFPKAAAQVMVDAPERQANLRKLRTVVNTPTARGDGTILSTPGYDEQTQTLYLPDPDLVVEDIPDEPTVADVRDAVKLIRYMLAEYAWNSDHDQANYIGMMLTPLMRAITPGPFKLGIIQARVRGSGKSFLAEGLRTLHGGEVRGDIPQADEEFRKQVTTMLIDSTGAVMTWDNLNAGRRVECAGLDALLTMRVWTDRVLGMNKNVRTPNDRLWTCTGNNVKIGGDLTRRCLWVTIDPKMAKPHLRTGFAIADWPAWVRAHRGEVLRALLVLIRAWAVAGRPAPDARSADSYGQWVRAVNGVLEHTRTVLGEDGIAGEFDHPDTVAVELTEEDTDLIEFMDAARKVFGTEAWTVRALLAKVDTSDRGAHDSDDPFYRDTVPAKPFPADALPGDMAEQAAKAHNVAATLSRRLGGWLKTNQGRYADGWAIEKAGDKGREGASWRLVAEGGGS